MGRLAIGLINIYFCVEIINKTPIATVIVYVHTHICTFNWLHRRLSQYRYICRLLVRSQAHAADMIITIASIENENKRRNEKKNENTNKQENNVMRAVNADNFSRLKFSSTSSVRRTSRFLQSHIRCRAFRFASRFLLYWIERELWCHLIFNWF